MKRSYREFFIPYTYRNLFAFSSVYDRSAHQIIGFGNNTYDSGDGRKYRWEVERTVPLRALYYKNLALRKNVKQIKM